MKYTLILLALFSVSALAAPAVKEVKKGDGPKACIPLDQATGFQRCETVEVICYLSKGGQQCWPKPIPTPGPSATPQAELKK